MATACELLITAGDEFTCAVSMDRSGTMSILKIVLRGAIDQRNGYVAYIILSRTDDDDFDYVEIDARDMEFFNKSTINTLAIECLLAVIAGITRQGRGIVLLVSNNAVKGALERACRGQHVPLPQAAIQWIDKNRQSAAQKELS